jgi:hypothetical protein
MITAEIDANNLKFKELADEQGLKVGQNVGAGVVGLIVWPMWFAMDFKGAASKEVVVLQSRQQYLTSLAAQRCAPVPPPPPPFLSRRPHPPHHRCRRQPKHQPHLLTIDPALA